MDICELFLTWKLAKMTGEWWKADTETVINQAMQTGLAPNLSDAYTINGLPGPLYNCSTKGKRTKKKGKLVRNRFLLHTK